MVTSKFGDGKLWVFGKNTQAVIHSMDLNTLAGGTGFKCIGVAKSAFYAGIPDKIIIWVNDMLLSLKFSTNQVQSTAKLG